MDKRLVVGIMVLLTTLIFILDVVFPRGETSSMLFVSVVGATLWLPGMRSVYISCAICTVATALAFFFSSPGPIDIDLINRLMSVLAFWMVGCLCILYKKNEQHSRRLAAIVEFSVDAIICKSVDGTIIYWNKGAEHLLGYKAEETMGRPRSFTIPPRLQRRRRSTSSGSIAENSWNPTNPHGYARMAARFRSLSRSRRFRIDTATSWASLRSRATSASTNGWMRPCN